MLFVLYPTWNSLSEKFNVGAEFEKRKRCSFLQYCPAVLFNCWLGVLLVVSYRAWNTQQTRWSYSGGRCVFVRYTHALRMFKFSDFLPPSRILWPSLDDAGWQHNIASIVALDIALRLRGQTCLKLSLTLIPSIIWNPGLFCCQTFLFLARNHCFCGNFDAEAERWTVKCGMLWAADTPFGMWTDNGMWCSDNTPGLGCGLTLVWGYGLANVAYQCRLLGSLKHKMRILLSKQL